MQDRADPDTSNGPRRCKIRRVECARERSNRSINVGSLQRFARRWRVILKEPHRCEFVTRSPKSSHRNRASHARLSPRQLAIQKRDQAIVKLLNEIAVGPQSSIKKIELEDDEKLVTIRAAVAPSAEGAPGRDQHGRPRRRDLPQPLPDPRRPRRPPAQEERLIQGPRHLDRRQASPPASAWSARANGRGRPLRVPGTTGPDRRSASGASSASTSARRRSPPGGAAIWVDWRRTGRPAEVELAGLDLRVVEEPEPVQVAGDRPPPAPVRRWSAG